MQMSEIDSADEIHLFCVYGVLFLIRIAVERWGLFQQSLQVNGTYTSHTQYGFNSSQPSAHVLVLSDDFRESYNKVHLEQKI